MTQEQKQFIIKALQCGVPALSEEYIAALEEAVRISETKQEDLKGAEDFQILDRVIYEITLKTLRASYPMPFMAEEYIRAYAETVNACAAKFQENAKAREEREKAEMGREEDNPTDKTKKSA